MKRQHLPNSPLGEVVYELRFAGDLSLPSAWAGLQRDLRAEFPNLMVPQVRDGDYVALKPVRLESADGREVVMLAINSFAFSSKQYKTFDPFAERFQKIYQKFATLYPPTKFTRAGLRYINWLPPRFPGAEQREGQVHPCLKLTLSGAEGIPLALSESQIIFQVREGERSLRVALVPQDLTGSAPRNASPAMLLDFDCFQTDVPAGEVVSVLHASHDLIERAFFGMVREEYVKYLKGEA